MKFVVCIKTDELGDFSCDDLTLGRLYEVIEEQDAPRMLRLIDDSGEDYLYPADYFEVITIPIPVARRLHDTVQYAH